MKILKKIFGGNTLYYPGCMTKFAGRGLLENYRKILAREGIDYVMLSEKELCCGAPIENAGAREDFVQMANKNHELFKKHSVTTIISNCPTCVEMFKIKYPKIVSGRWEIVAKHVSEVMTEKSKKKTKEKATYHDPCHLGRRLGIYDRPRKLIAGAGYEIVEMGLCGKRSFCCGGGGGVKSNDTELANRIARDRIEQAKKTGAKTLITACPMCWANLKENSGGEIEVKELSEIFSMLPEDQGLVA